MSYPSLKELSSSASANYSSTYRRSCISSSLRTKLPPLPRFPTFALPRPTLHPHTPVPNVPTRSRRSHTPLHTPSRSATPYHHIPRKFCRSNSRITHASCFPRTGLYTSTLIAYKWLSCVQTSLLYIYVPTRRYGSSQGAHRYRRRQSPFIENTSFRLRG